MTAVVIGASAGGPSALQHLLSHLDASFRGPVVVVNHLGPDGPDFLADMLAKTSRLPVETARERIVAQPGVVYVAPSGYHLLLEKGGRFALSMDEKVAFSRPSIDVLFASAATAYGANLAGVVLTGANADGAEGLHLIRRAGGLAFVQDPDEAAIRTMPTAALARAGADYCGSLAHIADRINRLPR
ncbi:chemotaxis protein CheB [Azorhizobium oxalatiphilum]|uniref:protein-glutamate methylesterase n=1 Tax=Azorhizobium oxalatiphilum TaxID=980631 RepID=A0A917C8Q9_9HYPH|nr:chemotaxis protein CheB [Azorhizobium oxalatiphilum]GGF78249.1 chemotaxis protein CheB [Azorhizobium oxalatiphilum]